MITADACKTSASRFAINYQQFLNNADLYPFYDCSIVLTLVVCKRRFKHMIIFPTQEGEVTIVVRFERLKGNGYGNNFRERMRLPTKLKLFNSIVISVLLYGWKTGKGLREIEERRKRLESFCLRKNINR